VIPGSVYGNLLLQGLIPDPYDGMNELTALKLMENDFRFRTVFTLTREQVESDFLLLRFDGIDTLADIYLNDVLLGHGILFDYSFLKKAAVDHKMAFERSGIDTLKIARKYLADLESRRLGYLCGYYGICHSAHRALGDARATVKLYQKLSEAFYEKAQAEEEPNPFRPKPLCYRVKRDTPLTVSQKEQLYKLMDRHKLVLDMDIAKLTRSEASRQIDRLLAVYGR